MTTSGKLWVGFVTLILVLVLSSLAIIVRVRSIESDVRALADARNVSATAKELEINTFGYALAVRRYVRTGDVKAKEDATAESADVDRYLREYEQLGGTDSSLRKAARFASMWQEMKSVGQKLIDAENRQPATVDSDRFYELRVGLDRLLDDEIQPAAAGTYETYRDQTLNNTGRIVFFIALLLITGAAIALITSWLVGRGVVSAEKRIRKSRELLRVTLASIGDAVITTDTEGRVTYLNAVAESLTGWTNEEAAGRPLESIFNIVNETSRETVENPAAKALREGTIVGLANHTILIAKDGTEIPIDDSASPIRDEKGTVTGAVLIFRDFTERRSAENALRESEEFSRSVLESSPDCVKVLDADGRLMSMNVNGTCLMEIDDFASVEGKYWSDLWPEERRGDVLAAIETARNGGTGTFQGYSPTYKGTPKWWEVFVAPIIDASGRVERFVSMSRDITGRKEAEEAVLESQRFLRSSMDALTSSVTVLDESGIIMMVNEAWRTFAAENHLPDANHALGTSYFQACGQDGEGEATAEAIRDVIAGRRERYETEYPCHSPTEKRWFLMQVTRFQGSGPVRAVVVHENITSRKQAEENLRETQSRLRHAANAARLTYVEVDYVRERITTAENFETVMGYASPSDEELDTAVGPRLLLEHAAEGDRQRLDSALNEFLDGKQSGTISYRIIGDDHIERFIESAWSAEFGQDGKPLRTFATNLDITERKRIEVNLEFLADISQKLVSLTNIDEMMSAIGAKIGGHFDLSLCAFVEISETADQAVITHDWHREDVPGLVGAYPLREFVEEEFIRTAKAGEIIVVRDVFKDRITDSEKFTQLKIGSFLCLPLIRDGEWRHALCLYHSAAHDWRPDEIELTRELAIRIWTRLERIRAEEMLSVSEDRYRSLFNSMDEGFCVLELIYDENEKPDDWTFLEINPAFERQTGMHDSVGKRMREMIPDHEDYWFEVYGKVVSTGEPVRFVNEAKKLGRWFDLNAFRIGGPGSRKVAVVFNDITERKLAEQALRESESLFRQLADTMPQIVWAAQPDGVLDYYNNRWFKYINLSPDSFEEAGWDQFVHPDDLPLAANAWADAISSGGPYTIEFRVKRADGQYRWFLTRALPVTDGSGEIIRWFGTCTDIHKQKQTAEELRQLAANLSQADHRKNEFLAMLAHELRNPLAPISNALQIMRMTSENGATAATEMMERQVGQLVRLVDDLLDVSRITQGKIELRRERIELASVVHHAVEAARPSCEKGGVELTVEMAAEPIYLDGDQIRLAQVIGNLLNNSCKFTDKGGDICLTVRREDEHALIRVRDTGIGIAPDQIKHIFELFVQADTSLERSISGLGIGLTLVKNLVEMHDGTIAAHSEGLGFGSEFTIHLPVLDEMEVVSSVPDMTINEKAGESRRILVVDDNMDSAESLSMLLKMTGNEVRMAHDGREAVDTAADFLPQVILLDIGLPVLNGYEAAREIRRQPWGEKMILIALTGWGQDEDRQRSKDAGFDSHMVKPVDHAALMKRLDELTGTVV